MKKTIQILALLFGLLTSFVYADPTWGGGWKPPYNGTSIWGWDTTNTVQRLIELDAGGNLFVDTAPTSGSGCTPYFNNALSNTATQIKSSAGTVYGWNLTNTNSSVVWVQLFNVANGSIVVGTTTPTLSFPVPPGATSAPGFDDTGTILPGLAFGTAINVAATTGPTNGVAPSSAVTVNFCYK